MTRRWISTDIESIFSTVTKPNSPFFSLIDLSNFVGHFEPILLSESRLFSSQNRRNLESQTWILFHRNFSRVTLKIEDFSRHFAHRLSEMKITR